MLARRPHTPSTAALEAQMAREPKEQAERWICYYPAHEEAAELFTSLRDHGLYRDEYKDFCEEMQRLRALRGKVKERCESKVKLRRVEAVCNSLENPDPTGQTGSSPRHRDHLTIEPVPAQCTLDRQRTKLYYRPTK